MPDSVSQRTRSIRQNLYFKCRCFFFNWKLIWLVEKASDWNINCVILLLIIITNTRMHLYSISQTRWSRGCLVVEQQTMISMLRVLISRFKQTMQDNRFPDSQKNKFKTDYLSQCKSLSLVHGTTQKSFVESRRFEENIYAARWHRCNPWYDCWNLSDCLQPLLAWVFPRRLYYTCGAKSVLRCGKIWDKSRVLDPLLRDLRDLFSVCLFFSYEIVAL